MLVVILEFLALAAVVVLVGTFLARAADQLAEIPRIGRLLIGSVVLTHQSVLAVRPGEPSTKLLKFLCPVDPSVPGARSLRSSCRRARSFRGKLIILTAVAAVTPEVAASTVRRRKPIIPQHHTGA